MYKQQHKAGEKKIKVSYSFKTSATLLARKFSLAFNMSDRTEFYPGRSTNKRDILVRAVMPQSFRHRNQEFFTAEKACRIKNFDIIHNSFVFGPDIIWWSVYILPQGVDPLPHIWDFASNPTGLYYFDDKLANKRIAYLRS